jgi:hypothetical protein
MTLSISNISRAVGSSGFSGYSGASGVSGTSGTSGAAGPSTTINATNDTSSSTLYPVMVAANGSNQTAKVTVSKLIFDAANGNFGVGGTPSVSNKPQLLVQGTFASPTGLSPYNGLYVASTDAVAADKGGVISLGGLYQTGQEDTRWAAIAGLKEDGTSGNYGGYLSFYSRAHGSLGPSERVRIAADGNVGIGTSSPTTKLTIYDATSSTLTLQGDATVQPIFFRASTNATSPIILVRKARGTVASPSAANTGDNAGVLRFQAYGGSNYRNVADILGQITTYTSDTSISGSLLFRTNNASTDVTERARFTPDGRFFLGSTNTALNGGMVNALAPAAAFSAGHYLNPTITSSTTSAFGGFQTAISTAASSFTLTNLYHFLAETGTIGSGSTVTNQYGFYAASSLNGATNDYGFYSDITSGANHWNFYANGSAANYFAGNVGIGVTPSAAKLHVETSANEVEGSFRNSSASCSSDLIQAYQTNASATLTSFHLLRAYSSGPTVRFHVRGDGEGYFAGNVGIGTSTPGAYLNTSGTAAKQAIFAQTSTNPNFIAFSSNGTERSYIGHDNSSGTGLFGTGAAYGMGIGTLSTVPIGFFTNNTERMRIDSNGDVMMGLTSIGTRIRLTLQGSSTSGGDYTFYAQNSAGTLLGFIRNDGVFNTGVATNSPYNLTNGNAANVYVDSGGALYRSTSSLRYKSNVQDATHGLADVLKLRSVTYNAKNSGDTVFGGLIAEEVHEAGLTEFVMYDKDGQPDALHYGNMVALLVKSIQEQQQQIDALKAEVAALKGN